MAVTFSLPLPPKVLLKRSAESAHQRGKELSNAPVRIPARDPMDVLLCYSNLPREPDRHRLVTQLNRGQLLIVVHDFDVVAVLRVADGLAVGAAPQRGRELHGREVASTQRRLHDPLHAVAG